jgi:N-acetylneuraminate synthase
MGASIIEKHVTLDRLGGGADDSFSLEEEDLTKLCEETKLAWRALGNIDYGIKSSEKKNIKFRRSLYFVKDMKLGDTITYENIKSIRPGFGLSPKNIEILIGKKIKKTVKAGTKTSWDIIEDE